MNSSVLLGYVRLARPANLPTAAADILAGVAIAGAVLKITDASFLNTPVFSGVLFLVFASIFLYAGGVVLNDVFDVEIDKIERPERPIPNGLIPLKSASVFGTILLVVGTVLAFLTNTTSGVISIILASSIVLYDAFSKKYSFAGPLNMGICRGLNLVLGMSVLGEITHWWYAIIPVLYVFAITLISRGEVHGNNKKHIIWAGILYAGVIFAVVNSIPTKLMNTMLVIPFLLLFILMVYRPLNRAYHINSPENIQKAVISGVLSLIVLDAIFAVGFGTWWYGLLVLLLLPLSIVLSKIFAVT